MIPFSQFTLDNGLQVIVHEDHSVQIAVMNILYDVGSRDEHPHKTGFAHLFEHLMFGGSKNIPSYDEPLQLVGGENNAFTNTDITNYYLTVPASNLETGFWLESDRMMSLSFDPKVLEVQQKVVVEEFKQRYLNQPYGDVWLRLRPLAYKVHPYQWATIGKEISHIEDATLDDVKAFFYRHYVPKTRYWSWRVMLPWIRFGSSRKNGLVEYRRGVSLENCPRSRCRPKKEPIRSLPKFQRVRFTRRTIWWDASMRTITQATF